MNQKQVRYIEEDKIDLRELWQVLVKRKITIITITGIITVLAIVYVLVAQPVYKGTAMLEIGVVVTEPLSISYAKDNKSITHAGILLDDVHNLRTIINQANQVTATVPKKTTLLLLSVEDHSKEVIKEKLDTAITFVLQRHKKLAELYTNATTKIKMTQLSKIITISNNAIKPKKKLIVIIAFITGLMLSIFIVFFLEFIQGTKQEEL